MQDVHKDQEINQSEVITHLTKDYYSIRRYLSIKNCQDFHHIQLKNSQKH